MAEPYRQHPLAEWDDDLGLFTLVLFLKVANAELEEQMHRELARRARSVPAPHECKD